MSAHPAPDRPIFVVGYQRSGTTLLQAVLGSHPRIAAPPEVHFWLRIHALEPHWGDLDDDANLRRVIHALLNPPIPLYAESGFDDHRIFQRLEQGPRTYRAILSAMMEDFAERHGKPRWAEKSPGQPASRILELFPGAQLLHIVRDPRDVVASSLQTPWTTPDAGTIARGWRTFTIDALRAGSEAGPGGYLRLSYEDLTREPQRILEGVFDFLGEDFDAALVDDLEGRRPTIAPAAAPWQHEALEPIRASRERRQLLSRADRLRVAAIAADLLEPLGYPPEPLLAVMAGRAVDLLHVRAALRRARQRLRARRARRDPDLLLRLVNEHLERGADAIKTASR